MVFQITQVIVEENWRVIQFDPVYAPLRQEQTCVYNFIFVSIFYFSIVRKLANSQKKLSGHMSKEAGIARRVFMLVATDALCWIPIIILKTMALGGISISPTVNGWVSVFILPINSALNPILYSVLTPQSIKFIKVKCGWR